MKQNEQIHTMTDEMIMHILVIIAHCIRDYSYPTFDIKTVVSAAYNLLLKHNKPGYDVHDIRILNGHILSVNGELFQIFRPRTHSRYDVRHIGNRATHPDLV